MRNVHTHQICAPCFVEAVDPAAQRFRKEGADAVLFTSSSTVKSFVDQQDALALEDGATPPAFGSIGPLTSKTLTQLNMDIAFESPQSSLDHFVVETISYLQVVN